MRLGYAGADAGVLFLDAEKYRYPDRKSMKTNQIPA